MNQSRGKKILGKIFIPSVELATRVVAFGTNLLLVRILTESDYGVYSYALNFALWASVIMDGGINNFAFDRALKGEIEKVNVLFNTRSYLSLLTIFILWVGSFFLVPNIHLQILIVLLAVFQTSTLGFFKLIFRAANKRLSDLKIVVLEPTIRFLFLVAIFLFSSILSVTDLVLSFLGIGILSLLIASRDLQFLRLRVVSWKEIGFWQTVRNSKYYLLYYFFIVGLMRIDAFFIKDSLGFEDLGQFYAAFALYTSIQLFSNSLVTVNLKDISRSKSISLQLIYLFLFTGLLTLIGYYTVDFFFDYLYPSSYKQAALYTKILLLGLPFFTVYYCIIYLFNYHNVTRLNAVILIAVFVSKFIFLLIWTPVSIDKFCFLYVAFEFSACIFFVMAFIYQFQLKKLRRASL